MRQLFQLLACCFVSFAPLAGELSLVQEMKTRWGSLQDTEILYIGAEALNFCQDLQREGGYQSFTVLGDREDSALFALLPRVTFIDRLEEVSLDAVDLVVCPHFPSDVMRLGLSEAIEPLCRRIPYGYLGGFTLHPLAQEGLDEVSLPLRILIASEKKGKVMKRGDKYALFWQSSSIPYHFSKASTNRALLDQKALIYSFSGGRYGDNVLSFAHALWLAYKYDLPLFYKPFDFSDKLALSLLPPLPSPNPYKESLSLQKEEDLLLFPKDSLITVPYFPESYYEVITRHLEHLPRFQVDWEDPLFLSELRKHIQPREKMKMPKLPYDSITVALHLRRGGGFDQPAAIAAFPLKYPPDEYYIAQLQCLLEIFKGQKVYVRIFTDDKKPKKAIQKIATFLKEKGVPYTTREKHNGPDENVLEDFFALPCFDCLIFTQSNYSAMASKLSDQKFAVIPIHCHEEGEKNNLIDEIEITFNGANTKPTYD